MRSFLLVLILLAMVTPAWAGEPPPSRRHLDDDYGLTKEQIERYAAPYFPEIRACYATHGRSSRAATGELSVRIVVHRNGSVHEVSIVAPNVVGSNLRELARCVRKTVETWHFPVRRYFTTAVLPYYFLHLALPSAGPYRSCWNPRGCPDKTAAR